MERVSEMYHVGIRTVKSVFRALKEEGYLQTEERRTAVVAYCQNDFGQGGGAVASVLRCRSSILAVHQTMAALMPPVFSLCARHCGEEDLKRWSQALARAKRRGMQERWKVCSAFLYFAMERSGNLLFRDLYSSLENYAKLPFFQNYRYYFEIIVQKGAFQSIEWVFEPMFVKEDREICRRFGVMYRTVALAANDFLEKTSRAFGEVREDEKEAYSWNLERGRDYYYTRIARDLMDKIRAGAYPEGCWLPSEAALAQQYGVCVSTARRAVATLRDLGYGQTVNAKGTRVIPQEGGALTRCMKNKRYARDALEYLSGLQLMTIAIRPAALLAFEEMSEKDRRELSTLARDDGGIPLDGLTSGVIDRLPLPPLRNILCEVNRMLRWGNYFSFSSKGPAREEMLRQMSMEALISLQIGDAEGFASQMSECYGRVFAFIREEVAGQGLWEAERMADMGK